MSATIWIKQLLSGLDRFADHDTCVKIMETCGKVCPFTHLPDDRLMELRLNCRGEEEFLDQLCSRWRLRREEGEYYVVFDRCYCPLVNQDLQGVSKTLCHCTVGNIKHKFAIALNRRVDVVMEKTILAGDDECRFQIRL